MPRPAICRVQAPSGLVPGPNRAGSRQPQCWAHLPPGAGGALGWGAGCSPAACTARQACHTRLAPVARRKYQRRLQVSAFDADTSLLTLPVFPLPNVLHPTQAGVLTVFEPSYLAMFRAMQLEYGSGGKGARFVHLLSPSAAPPALFENAVDGLPRIGCCAEVQTIQEQADGTLRVEYTGARRVQLLLVAQREPYVMAAAQWYDDDEAGPLDPTVDVLEREAAKLLQQIQRLSAAVSPGTSALPDAVAQYAPPAVQKQTSYDALKAAGHQAAGHIDMWRRHGSVYKTQSRAAAASPDPYQAIREALGKGRRQELFSFAAAQLLVMGTPERCALLLSQDTGARLNFVLAALRPYLLELQAKASLQKGLQ